MGRFYMYVFLGFFAAFNMKMLGPSCSEIVGSQETRVCVVCIMHSMQTRDNLCFDLSKFDADALVPYGSVSVGPLTRARKRTYNQVLPDEYGEMSYVCIDTLRISCSAKREQLWRGLEDNSSQIRVENAEYMKRINNMSRAQKVAILIIPT